MNRQQRRADHTADLITQFPDLLDRYDQATPFAQEAQLRLHRNTIGLRREHTSPGSAINDPRFLQSLYDTLQAWGIGRRASILLPIDQFSRSLSMWIPQFDALGDLAIDNPELDEAPTADALWEIIAGMDIVENQAKIVALSKTIHHILPDLLPPIDRAYTQEFFLLQPVDFQYQQERAFRTIWHGFLEIAGNVELGRFRGSGWRTSRTKVIDNAIVAYVMTQGSEASTATASKAPDPDISRSSDSYPVFALYGKLAEFKTELEDAGLKPNSVDTYVGRSKTFVDWLAGTYHPRGPNDTD